MKLLLSILYIALTMTHSYAASSFSVVINNSSNIVAEGLSKEQLKSLFLGYHLYLKGERIKLVHIDLKSEAMVNFTALVLGMSTREYSAYWRRKLFSGKGIPPREFNDQEELISFIQKNKNTIGILGPSQQFSLPLLVFPADSLTVVEVDNSNLAHH